MVGFSVYSVHNLYLRTALFNVILPDTDRVNLETLVLVQAAKLIFLNLFCATQPIEQCPKVLAYVECLVAQSDPVQREGIAPNIRNRKVWRARVSRLRDL
jgi:hypothetical protein